MADVTREDREAAARALFVRPNARWLAQWIADGTLVQALSNTAVAVAQAIADAREAGRSSGVLAPGLSDDSTLARWRMVGMTEREAMAVRDVDAQGYGSGAVYLRDEALIIEGDGEERIPLDVLAEVLRGAGYEVRKVGA